MITPADPYEIENLAADPRYAEDLERLRGELERWQQEYGDLGLIPEAELIERWRPGGVMPLTEPPQLEIVDGQIFASCATAGASIGWTSDPPAGEAAPGSAFESTTGEPQTEGRSWKLYSEPVAAPEGRKIWFRAHRLGYRASPDVLIRE